MPFGPNHYCWWWSWGWQVVFPCSPEVHHGDIYLRAWIISKQEFDSPLLMTMASLGTQIVKNLPAIWETQVQSLGWKDSPGEGKGNPLQYSCLKSYIDRGAWRAPVHGCKELNMTEQLTFSLSLFMTLILTPAPWDKLHLNSTGEDLQILRHEIVGLGSLSW